MLRMLHTSDWHLGALFHEQPREADELHAFEQIVALCRDREVDVVLVAGDVFDTANPSADAQRRYYEALRKLITEAGVGTVVVIGGNHDNGLRLDGPRELLAGFKVHVRGQLARTDAAEACLVDLRDRAGQVRAVCAAVPYLREGDLRPVQLGETVKEQFTRQTEALHQRFAEIRGAAFARARGLPVVVMGHFFASGCATSEDERPVFGEQVGKLSQAQLAPLAEGAAYAALGHLHKPQKLGGREHWRYSGSLLPNGFDQAALVRGVVLAEVPSDGGPATVERVELAAYRRYVRVEGTFDEVATHIAALEAAPSDEPAAWLQVTIRLEGPRPGVASEIASLARERGYTALSIRPVRSDRPAPVWSAADELNGIDTLDPMDVFEQLHAQQYDQAPDDELRNAFRALLTRVQQEG